MCISLDSKQIVTHKNWQTPRKFGIQDTMHCGIAVLGLIELWIIVIRTCNTLAQSLLSGIWIAVHNRPTYTHYYSEKPMLHQKHLDHA
jgi:hypothetical protein